MSGESFYEKSALRARVQRLRRELEEANTAASEASARAEQAAVMAAEDTAYLSWQVEELHKDVSRLTIMVGVLAEALAQRGGIDMTWAASRVQEQLAKLDPPPPPPAPIAEPTPDVVETYRGEMGADPAEQPKMVPCDRCYVPVDEKRTYVTEIGTVCESCYRR